MIHPVVRDGLVAVLSTQPDFAVAGEAGSRAEAVQKAADLWSDLVLLGLEMPGMDGVEALEQMRTYDPNVRIIVFTAFDSADRILAAVQAGAQGYILKGAPATSCLKLYESFTPGDRCRNPWSPQSC